MMRITEKSYYHYQGYLIEVKKIYELSGIGDSTDQGILSSFMVKLHVDK